MYIEDRDRRIINLLKSEFPSGIIMELNKKSILYREVYDQAKLKKMTLSEYMKGIGFVYVRKKYTRKKNKEVLPIDALQKQLNILYPDKAIPSFVDIQKKNKLISDCIKYYLKSQEVDIKTFFNNLNFIFGKSSNSADEVIYDVATLKKLYQDYDLNIREMANILNTTHQNIWLKLKNKKSQNPIWENAILSNEEITVILEMIETGKYKNFSNEDLLIRFYQNKNELSKVCIFLRSKKQIKCIFNLPKEIYSALEARGYTKFEFKDVELLAILINNNCINDGLVELNDNEIHRKIQSRANLLRISVSNYIEYLGYKYISAKSVTDDMIITLLKKYENDNGYVKIPSGTRDYINCFRYANQKGYNGKGALERFITSYGFKYERNSISARDTMEMYKDILYKNYVVDENKVYISSLDPFYNRLTSYSYRFKKISLDTLIEQLGFKKINRDELPNGYIPFDWTININKKLLDINNDDNIIELLQEFVIDDENTIFLDTSTYVYEKLFKIANIKGITINTLIDKLGFRRIYAWEYNNIINNTETNNKTETIEEIAYRNNLLEKLHKIQGNPEEILVKTKKIKRSEQLVSTLKKLYNYKCQICCPDDTGFSVPPIEKNSKGELYVEVHHITPISEAINIDNSDEEIDTYKNAIVVCCYHHKYLHYYHEGFDKIVNINGTLYFKSKYGDLLKINTNYHLDIIEK